MITPPNGFRNLIDLAALREDETVRRVLLSPGFLQMFHEFLANSIGWQGIWSWYALKVPRAYLLPPELCGAASPDSDVDILSGLLEFPTDRLKAAEEANVAAYPDHAYAAPYFAALEVAQSGHLVWPPPTSFLAAAEVITWHRRLAPIPATEQWRKLERYHAKTEALAELGLDRVALVAVAIGDAAPLAGPKTLGAMMASLATAQAKQARITEYSARLRWRSAGLVEIACGAIAGHSEGETSGVSVGPPVPTPDLSKRPRSLEASERRTAISRALATKLEGVAPPRSLPVIIRACSNFDCATLYLTNDSAPCPSCGSVPR